MFVVTEVGGTTVVAYYGWCMGWLDIQGRAVTHAERHGSARSRSRYWPAWESTPLTKVGVWAPHCCGTWSLGSYDSHRRSGAEEAARARRVGGGSSLLHVLPDLDPSPTDELHLVLLMKDLRRTLDG